MRVRLHKNNNRLVPKWKKHGASSSNPSTTKHRDAAKMQLLSSLPSAASSAMDISATATAATNRADVDRISQYSKTTLGTTATNATAIQVTPRVLQTLLDRQPAKNDQQQMVIWLDGISRAYCAFHRSDPTACLEYVQRLFEICVNECLLSVYKRVQTKATNVLKTIMKVILKPQLEALRATPLLKQLFQIVEHGLTYAYTLSWNYVLHLLGDLFELLGKDAFDSCENCLRSLAGLRATKDFSFLAELDATVGKAIRVFGPKQILQVIPLNLTGTVKDVLLEQSWLLPLLRDNISHTELSHFVSYFLPIAFQLQTTAEQLREKGDTTNATVLSTLQDQLWSLFPGYCSYATDISSSLKLVAKGIGTSLNKRPDLRLYLLSGLRNLISKTENETDQQEIAKYAKNYLPLLFNLYTTEKWNMSRDPVRQSVFETIKRYLTITDATLSQTFFDKCLEKTQNADVDQVTLTYLLDIVLGLTPHLDQQRLQLLDEKLKQLFSMKEGSVKRSVMKKSYRILEELCARSTESLQEFVNEQRSAAILDHLLVALAKSQSALKGAQLRCISSLLNMPSNQSIARIKQIGPQVIQCLHEINSRTRHDAYLLIIRCARLWTSISEQSFIDSLTGFFHFVMAGLVGPSPSMTSATVLAISRLALEFRENIAGAILDELLATLVLVLQSKERQIVQAALSFCRVLLIIVNETTLSKYIEQIARSLAVMREENNFNYRSKLKLILQKLVKIFGFEALRDMFPESFHPQLSYINKMRLRKERRRKGTSISGQTVITKVDAEDEYVDDNETTFTVRPKLTIDQLLDDSDDDNEQNLGSIGDARTIATARTTASTRRRKQQAAMWIKEGQEDDPIDLTEPTAARSIYATKPLTNRETEAMKQAAREKRKNSRFRTAPDGRLIIDVDEEEGAGDNAEEDEDSDDEDIKRENLKDLMETLSLGQRARNKRKRAFDDDNDDFEDEQEEKQSFHSKYRPGGGGIHRTLTGSVNASQQRPKRPGESYKAKRGSGGDRKLANKHDPYAYIKLDFNALNKRKRGKFQGQFEQIVGAAKRGANRGAKLGAKERHQKKSVKRLKSK